MIHEKSCRAYLYASSFFQFSLGSFGLGLCARGFNADTLRQLYTSGDPSVLLMSPYTSAAIVFVGVLGVSATGLSAVMRDSPKLLFLSFLLTMTSIILLMYLVIVCLIADASNTDLNSSLSLYIFSIERSLIARSAPVSMTEAMSEDRFVRENKHSILVRCAKIGTACVALQLPGLACSVYLLGADWVMMHIQRFFSTLTLCMGAFMLYLSCFTEHITDTNVSRFSIAVSVFMIFKSITGFVSLAKPHYRGLVYANLLLNAAVIVFLTTSTALSLVKGTVDDTFSLLGICGPYAELSSAAPPPDGTYERCKHSIVVESYLKESYMRTAGFSAVSVIVLALNLASSLYLLCENKSKQSSNAEDAANAVRSGCAVEKAPNLTAIDEENP